MGIAIMLSWNDRKNEILKSGDAMERLAEVDAVMIDKTGTMTDATLRLTGHADPGTLEAAAATAANSTHPLAQALSRACPVTPMVVVQEFRGEGLDAPSGARLGSARFVGLANERASDRPVTGIGRGARRRFPSHSVIKPNVMHLI